MIELPVWEKYIDYPVRVCRTLHECAFCKLPIRIGEQYKDGGYGRRAHLVCYQDMKRRNA